MENLYHDMIEKAETVPLSAFESLFPSVPMEELASLFASVNRDFSEICTAAGMKGRDVCRRFGISYRTAEAWTSGRRECPVYLRLMFQELLGIYTPPSFLQPKS